jgi:outer membrane receptor protein involved in Fe transport
MKGEHTMKFGADVRRVGYVDIESFGGSDDFGQFIFNQGTFSGNAFADLLLGLPTKTYVAQSGPDVHAHTTQTGVYAQDEWRVSNKLTLTSGLRWQALPPFVSPLGNLTAFDARNGGIIYPGNSARRPGFLETINTCTPSNPNDPADPCGGPVNSALGCAPVNPALPCGPATLAGAVGLGAGVREFYKKNFQPRIGFAYRLFGNNKTGRARRHRNIHDDEPRAAIVQHDEHTCFGGTHDAEFHFRWAGRISVSKRANAG